MVSEALIEEFGRSIALKGFSLFTVTTYKANTEKFLKWMLESKGINRPEDVRREDLSDFQNFLYTRTRIRDGGPLSLATKAKHILAVKSFFRFLARSGVLPYNPASDLEIPRINQDRLRPVLDERQVVRFLESIRGSDAIGIRDRAMFELLYSTGLRNSELRELSVDDVDFKSEEVVVRHAKGYYGERQRIVPAGALALAWTKEYIAKARPKLLQESDTVRTLFITRWGGPVSISALSLICRQYAKRSGLDKRISPHILRHSFAVHLLKRGADIRFVQEMLGHASLDSTKLYTKLEISDLKKIHRRYHPRER